MARDLRNFGAVVLTVTAVGLGLGAIGLTQDRPNGADEWRVVDADAVAIAGITGAVEYTGADHCGWQEIRFLEIDPDYVDADGWIRHRQFVRDPAGVIGNPPVLTPFQSGVEIPHDAVYSGLARGAWRLWLGADGRAVYLVGYETAERWPRTEYLIGCD